MVEIPRGKYYFALALIIAMMILCLIDFENKTKVLSLIIFFFSGLVAEDLFHSYQKDKECKPKQ